MNDGNIHLSDEDSASDLDAEARKSAATDPDRLPTTRHAAHPPAPRPNQKSYFPPAATPPPSAPFLPPGGGGATRYRTEPPPALPRTSWWRGLIASTLAPPISSQPHAWARIAGTTCVGAATVLVVASLVIGLRGEPSPSSSPLASATIVVTRSLLALGLLAFSHSLLRMAERIFKTPT